MSRAAGYMREEIEALKTENDRLRAELAIAQGTNRALEEWIKGYRIFGRKGAWLSWLVNGAPDREQGKAAAKEIVRLQVALDEALAVKPVWAQLYADECKRVASDQPPKPQST